MKSLWNKIRLYLIALLSGNEAKAEDNKSVNQAASKAIGLSNKPGIDCPQCGTRILTSIDMILGREPIECVQCGLKLNINQEASKPALESLKKLDRAIKDAEINSKTKQT